MQTIDTTIAYSKNVQTVEATYRARPAYREIALGEVAAAYGKTSEARDLFMSSIDKDPLVTALVNRRIGDLYLSVGQIAPALDAFIAAKSASNNKGYSQYLGKRISLLKKMYKADLKAVGWSDASKTPRPKTQSQIAREKWSNTIIKNGITPTYVSTLLSSTKKLGGEKRTVRLLRNSSRIKGTIATDTLFVVAKKLWQNGYFSQSSDWLLLAVDRADFSQKVDRVSYLNLRAQLNFSLKNYANAITWGETKFKEFGTSPILLYNTARAYRRTGNETKANYYYQKYVEDFPNGSKAYDIAWYVGWGYEERNELDSAIALFDGFSRKYAKKKYGDDAAFRVGLNLFRQQKYAKSIDAFVSLQKRFKDSELLTASSYWLARSYQAVGDSSKFDSTLQDIFTTTPIDYYAWRGRELVGDTSYSTVKINLISDEQWHTKLTKHSKGTLDSLFTPLELNEIEFLIFLGSLGHDKEIEYYLKPFENRFRDDLVAFYHLSQYLFDIGVYHRSYWLAKRLYYRIPYKNRWNFPKEYIELLYPDVYDAELKNAAAKVGVPENLVRAIMRQESMFSPQIMSYVGAMGLMQIMPYTGKEIADDLDTTYRVDMLLDPQVNLRFGSYYIGKLLKQFNGAEVEAIASYNGGPHNVKKWVARNGEVHDDTPYFVECVGFSETRNYVKRVLENYWTYNYLNTLK